MTSDGANATLAGLERPEIEDALRGSGLFLDVGLATLRVRSDVPALACQLQSVYRHFPAQTTARWADLHVHLSRPRGLRRWLRAQVLFRCDGEEPFEPFAADHPLPLLEWGANFLIGRRFNDMLLLHAGVVERDGFALVMPALPGSGKSTLTAALSLRGWRLLSDEFGALDLQAGDFRPALKPVALKNESIEVIRRYEPSAELGPEFLKTRKGRVAHLAPSAKSVAGRHRPAWPGAVVLPRWQAGSTTRLEPVLPQLAFSTLAFNAFNYATTGAAGFQAVVALSQGCPAWQLIYSDLDDALAQLANQWPAVVQRAAQRRAATHLEPQAVPP